jgi:hypothetical protein
MTSQLVKSLYHIVDNPLFNKDCISGGQLSSKDWLIEELALLDINLGTVFLCAGWYATLATMLFESDIKLTKIRSFDLDETCYKFADTINRPWVIDGWQFKASTLDVHDIRYPTTYTTYRANGTGVELTEMPDTIINTSCEHIANFDEWYSRIPTGTIVILQSNNYFELEEHINCSHSLTEFVDTTPMSTVMYQGELSLDKYNRYMIIGIK